MGTSPFALVMTLLAAAPPVGQPPPMTQAAFEQLLLSRDVAELQQGCRLALTDGMPERLQLIRDRLLALDPRPQSVDQVFTTAQALMVCRSPESALVILNRWSPAAGEQRRRWLLMAWQAADAALDHSRAALMLRRLVNGDLQALEREELVEAGDAAAESPLVRVNGLDRLAHHEASAGDSIAAAAVLLAGRETGAVAARRLGMAADLLAEEDSEQADALLELALDQAAADEAWSVAVELLRVQLRLQLAAGGDGARPRERLERLTSRLDDRYSLWTLQEGASEPDPSLRSPREPGGHAAVKEPSVEATP